MLSKEMEAALNEQIKYEYYSAYLYLSMAAYFEDIGLPGFSNWMRNQYKEEVMHGMKFFDYVFERGGKVVLEAIDKPESDWKTPLYAFEETLRHEQFVTSRINALMDQAIAEKDHATANFLQWFVGEQVEEEDAAKQVIQQLKLVESTPGGLFMLDKELGTRVFVEPPAE